MPLGKSAINSIKRIVVDTLKELKFDITVDLDFSNSTVPPEDELGKTPEVIP
jgi:hypothetical protein